MCLACDGLGIRHDFDPDLLVPDPALSVWDGAIAPLGPVKSIGKWRRHLFEGAWPPTSRPIPADPLKARCSKAHGVSSTKKPAEPGSTAPATARSSTDGKAGRRSGLMRRNGLESRTSSLPSIEVRPEVPTGAQLEPLMRSMTCPECHRARLNPRARAVRVGGQTLVNIGQMPVGDVVRFFDSLASTPSCDSATVNGDLRPRLLALPKQPANASRSESHERSLTNYSRKSAPGSHSSSTWDSTTSRLIGRPNAFRRRSPAHQAG